MAHFAKLDENWIVTEVVVISDYDCMDEDGNESESVGVQFCQRLFGGGNWKQTSYNGRIRGRFAGLGYEYNRELDVFIAPKRYKSFVLDEETGTYVPPVPYPEDGEEYYWDESAVNWALGKQGNCAKPFEGGAEG